MANTRWKNPTQTATYNSWRSMRNRILFGSHPAHNRYKEKGVTICGRWESYDLFFEDMGERPFGTTLDRIDNNGNYEPSNCRWASMRCQQNNKSSLSKVEKDGVVKTIGEWAFELCLTQAEISKAYKRYSKYGAVTFDELFCGHLLTYRTENRDNLCLVCKKTDSIKWRKYGKLCNTCYHRALRWSKRSGMNIEKFPEWKDIAGYATLVSKELEKC